MNQYLSVGFVKYFVEIRVVVLTIRTSEYVWRNYHRPTSLDAFRLIGCFSFWMYQDWPYKRVICWK